MRTAILDSALREREALEQEMTQLRLEIGAIRLMSQCIAEKATQVLRSLPPSKGS